MRTRTSVLLVTALVVAASIGLRADRSEQAAPVPYAAVRAALLEVLVNDHLSGSGWIATHDGLAITAAHVLGDGRGRVEVLLGRERLRAEVVARDRGNDVALLRLPKREGWYPFLPLAERLPAPGRAIWLMGGPIYRHGVLLHGTVALPEPTYEWYPTQSAYVRASHVAATVARGVSGGPWFDDRGRVVALQSGTMTSKDVPVGVAFVVPANTLTKVIAHGRDAATPTLGCPFEELWEQSREVLARFPARTEGVCLRKPVPGGPLHGAGVREWELVVAVDGHQVRFRDDLIGHLRRKQPGDTIELEVLLPDDAGRRTVEVTLDSLES